MSRVAGMGRAARNHVLISCGPVNAVHQWSGLLSSALTLIVSVGSRQVSKGS